MKTEIKNFWNKSDQREQKNKNRGLLYGKQLKDMNWGEFKENMEWLYGYNEDAFNFYKSLTLIEKKSLFEELKNS